MSIVSCQYVYFQTMARWLAAGFCKGQDAVKCVICKNGEMFLLNTSEAAVRLGPCELFGFNVGNFKEVFAGAI